ncbi:MAG: potassium channel protein [Bacteroidota bacterium]
MSLLPYSHLPKVFTPLLLIGLIILMGVIGFMSIEHFTLVEAFYMTIITVATVGFQEVHPLSEGGRLFTAFLIITSFGTFAYAITSISQYVLDGEFRNYFKSYRVNTVIQKLENHIVICGYGRNGKQAAQVFKNKKQRFVVIEKSKELFTTFSQTNIDLFVEGDATQDEVLQKAGIEKARALITTLPIDADNLFIVLSARALNPKLTIISRASDDNSDRKLKTAGADNVIMPDKIGGAHMASLVMQPDVMEFVDFITGQGGDNIKLEEITFEHLPPEFKNKTIRELEIRNKSGANIIGFKTASSEYIVNPSPDTKMIADAKLFVLGTSEQINRLKEIFK